MWILMEYHDPLIIAPFASQVLLDDTLQSIFKRKKFTLFSMEKYLSPMCKVRKRVPR